MVINQDTIAYSVPLTVAEAQARDFTPGSCMTVRPSRGYIVNSNIIVDGLAPLL